MHFSVKLCRNDRDSREKSNSQFPIECTLENPWGSNSIFPGKTALKCTSYDMKDQHASWERATSLRGEKFIFFSYTNLLHFVLRRFLLQNDEIIFGIIYSNMNCKFYKTVVMSTIPHSCYSPQQPFFLSTSSLSNKLLISLV